MGRSAWVALSLAVTVCACGKSTPEAEEPSGVTTPETPGDPIAIVVLVQTNRRFVIPQLPGVLDTLGKIGDRRTIALVTAGEDVAIAREFGGTLAGHDLPEPEADAPELGVSLEEGVLAAAELLATRPGRRVLIYVGDGTDAMSRDVAADTAGAIAQSAIELYAIGYDPAGALDPAQKRTLEKLAGERLRYVTEPDALAGAAREIKQAIESH